jgi:hypothetical protein
MGSPTSRTLELLWREGFVACVVEKWIPQARRRIDAFGFGDILACQSGRRASHYVGIWLIQCTSGDNHASRVKKIVETPAAEEWRAAGGRIAVVSWSKRGGRGERKLWQPRWEEVVLGAAASVVK